MICKKLVVKTGAKTSGNMLGESLAMRAAHADGGDCEGGTIGWQHLGVVLLPGAVLSPAHVCRAKPAYPLCGKACDPDCFCMSPKFNARTVGTLPNSNTRPTVSSAGNQRICRKMLARLEIANVWRHSVEIRHPHCMTIGCAARNVWIFQRRSPPSPHFSRAVSNR
jgi:hypothetical protein